MMSKGTVVLICSVLGAVSTIAVAVINSNDRKPDQPRVVVRGQITGLPDGFVVYVVGQEKVSDAMGKFSFETSGQGPYSIVVQPAATDSRRRPESYKLTLDGTPLGQESPVSLVYTVNADAP
jgi:hypothetical protein